MANKIRKVATVCMVLALCISMMTVPAFADNNKDKDNTGTGQTQVHIHLNGTIGSNKDDVTIIVGDNEYHGSIQGSKLEIEMDTTDNGFDFGKDESMDVGFKNNTTGETGTLTLTHKEGNGNNIGKEHDNGLNNFNGDVKPTEPPAPQPPAPQPPAPQPPAPQPMMVNDFGGEIDIFDEDVPLADVPQTGDISAIWIALSGASAAGMFVLGKKREGDEE